ncbi:hypothetical protein ABMA46_10095 [Mesorhizobium sp. CN5-321]|uniref:hypothetical protein n=1 Tax=Mesorhizobium hunchu TaxID=3157708 RepID=UPI0032B7EA09
MPDTPVSVLFAEVLQWAEANGAPGFPPPDGLWRGETDEWKVEFNLNFQEYAGLPYACARLINKRYPYRAILSPFDGCVIGADEDNMIAHFRGARKAREGGTP